MTSNILKKIMPFALTVTLACGLVAFPLNVLANPKAEINTCLKDIESSEKTISVLIDLTRDHESLIERLTKENKELIKENEEENKSKIETNKLVIEISKSNIDKSNQLIKENQTKINENKQKINKQKIRELRDIIVTTRNKIKDFKKNIDILEKSNGLQYANYKRILLKGRL